MALRTPLTAQPHLYIGDSTGRPLDYGRVYFGEPNRDPEFYPIDIYLDPEMTIAAAQPVRTKGGFMDVGGNLAELHAAEFIYSLKVLDQYGRQVFYKPEMYRNNVSDFLVDEITRATAAETLIAGNLTAETQRAVAAEEVIADAVVTEKNRAMAAESVLDNKYQGLSTTINSVGGGKKAYTTYAKMEAAAALPDEDPLKLPANSSVDVTNDSDGSKNGNYAYDGTIFTKAAYDPKTLLDNTNAAINGWVSDYNGALYDVYTENTRAVINIIYVRTRASMLVAPSGKAAILKQWSDVLTDLAAKPDKIATSAEGVLECVKLTGAEAFVYVLSTGKFDVMPREQTKLSEHVLLAAGNYGRLKKGSFYDVRQMQVDANSAYFHWANGYKSTSFPYVEQADDSAAASTAAVYIKFNDVARLRLLDPLLNLAPDWATIIADITEQSPASIVTSKKGVSQCIALKDNSLVYDLYTKKYRMTAGNYHNPATEVLLASGIFGQLVGGVIRDWWLTKNVNNLLEGSSGGGGTTPPPAPLVAYESVETKPQAKFVSHGGLSALHEYMVFNSAAAMVEAGKYGYWGIETDLVETKDGKWAIIHDLTVNEYTYNSGTVKNLTMAQLKEMDASKLSAAYGWSNSPIMELSELLDICVAYNLSPILEFKSVPTDAGIDDVVKLVRDRMPISACRLTSFDESVITAIRARHADVPLLLTVAGNLTPAKITYAQTTKNCILAINYPLVTAADKAALQSAGVRAAAYTVPQNFIDGDTLGWADYIITDAGLPHNFDKGTMTLNYKSGTTFSGLTSTGTSTVSGRDLTLTADIAYLDVPVNAGDVITVSAEIKHVTGGAGSNSTFKIDGYDTGGALVRTYTSKVISGADSKTHSMTAFSFDRTVTKVRVSLTSTASSSAVMRLLNVRKFEV